MRIVIIYGILPAPSCPSCRLSPVVARYYRELLNFCLRSLKDRAAAADVVQESYARFLSMQRAGQAIAEPRALLHQTARRLLIDGHRRAAVRDHDELDTLLETQQPAAPKHAQPEEIYAYEEYATAIAHAIEALPARCREAFILNRFDGLSHQQVAERMGISRNMVAQHIMRGVLACKVVEKRMQETQP